MLIWVPVLGEGLRGRAGKLAKSVPEGGWKEGPTHGQSLAIVAREEGPRYCRRPKTLVRRWSDAKGKVYTDYLLTTLTDLSADQMAKLYNGRSAIESGIKGTSAASG